MAKYRNAAREKAPSKSAEPSKEVKDGNHSKLFEDGESIDTGEELGDTQEVVPTSLDDSPEAKDVQDDENIQIPLLNLSLQLWDDNSRNVPTKKDLPDGAVQYSWSNIGFPNDRSLVVKDFEDQTHINISEPSIDELSEDILRVKSQPATEIADGGIQTCEENGRTIEIFTIRGKSTAKVTFKDADISKGDYSKLKIAKDFERRVTLGCAAKPPLNSEQYVATHILLCVAGKMGEREGYWRRVRDLAQRQLYLDPHLQEQVEEQLILEKDPALVEMLGLVEQGLPTSSPNPYYQAQRNKYALEQGFFHQIKNMDIVMVLDKSAEVMFAQFSESFKKLFPKGVQADVVESFETWSTLQPGLLPESTRHGLHLTDWIRERPDLDYRNLENDAKMAKSLVYHFGLDQNTGDPHGDKAPTSKKDNGKRLERREYVSQQLEKLQYSAFGACTEAAGFYFNLVDPGLYQEYKDVSKEVEKLPGAFQTRRTGEHCVMRALVVNVMTDEHQDKGDWKYGLASIVPLGIFEGGDMLLRELGLQIEAPPGCVQLIRGREMRHSITKYTGRRFVVVSVISDSVKQWSQRRLGMPAPESLVSEVREEGSDFNDGTKRLGDDLATLDEKGDGINAESKEHTAKKAKTV